MGLLGFTFHFGQRCSAIAIFVEAFEIALQGRDVSALGIADVFFGG